MTWLNLKPVEWIYDRVFRMFPTCRDPAQRVTISLVLNLHAFFGIEAYRSDLEYMVQREYY
jgi:hypothetical protein